MPSGRPACVRGAQILLPGRPGAIAAQVLDRAALQAGDDFAGPAVIEQEDTTTLLAPGWQCRVDPLGNLLIESAGIAGGRG